MPAGEFKGALHHIVSLEGRFKKIETTGVCGRTIVRDELHAWGEATTITIVIDESKTAPGRIVAVDLTICDHAGRPVRDWNGHVKVSIGGDVRLFPYNEAGEVLAARGEGRTYLQFGHTGGEVTIFATADGLEPSSMKSSPGR